MRRSALDRYLPLGYFSLAVAMVAILLPTALRPPEPPPPSSAELSPDAPPDDEVLLTELGRGSSGTAGAGTKGIGGGPEVVADVPRVAPPRSCPRGVGTPPRQVESIYAPPCALPFAGDNGGVTFRGVTGTEIRIAVRGVDGADEPSNVGPYPPDPGSSENAWDRTFRVFEQYFNENFQFYGRRVRFYANAAASTSVTNQRNAAVRADQEFGVFAAAYATEPQCDYYPSVRISAWCYGPRSVFEKGAPHLYGYYMDGNQYLDLLAEYLCKKLAGRNAVFAGDPLYQQSRRRFGYLLYQTRGWAELGPYYAGRVKQRCGEDVVVYGADLDTTSGQSDLATAVTKFKAAGVTTIIPGVDWISAAAFTRTATSQSWFPEWLVTDGGSLSRNQLAQYQDPPQWRNAFGITGLEMERPQANTDCYRSYRTIDVENTPDYEFCVYVHQSLFMLMMALQVAGPNLTPATIQKGLYALGYRFPARPVWAMGGGFGPGDYTYTDDVTEIWWDPTAPTPNGGTGTGAYRYVRGGKRYRAEQMPQEDPPVFRDGVTMTEDTDSTG